MEAKELKYWVGFSLIPGIGRIRMSRLEKHFSSLEDAWQADTSQLKAAGLESSVLRSVNLKRPRISPDEEMDKMSRLGVRAYTYHDPEYPSRLKEIYDYPPLLYVRGEMVPEDEWCVAVVGTRRATAYGRQVTEELVMDLARSRITIVSGLARGIDSVAHRTALEAGGRTIAVFGCGLDMVYPRENADLARRIMKQGALVSEYPLGTGPRPDKFPRRNRIMSGMSLGVLVTEAGYSSGAMITARMAEEHNREVFAVPGGILSPTSCGGNSLIRDGAKLVADYTDIMEELNLTSMARREEVPETVPTSDTESLLLKNLSAEPSHIDKVCRSTGLPVAEVSSTLAMMEIKGLIKQVSNMSYVLARETRREYGVKVE